MDWREQEQVLQESNSALEQALRKKDMGPFFSEFKKRRRILETLLREAGQDDEARRLLDQCVELDRKWIRRCEVFKADLQRRIEKTGVKRNRVHRLGKAYAPTAVNPRAGRYLSRTM
jgi:RecJ-like exonuclease